MKAILKPTLLSVSLGLFSLGVPVISYADHHGNKPHTDNMPMPTGEMMKQVEHASFMPNLMKHILKNKKQLNLSEQQAKALNDFRLANSPKIRQMAQQVSELEAKAKQMTLDNYPPQNVIEVGGQSIQLRHNLMISKLQCRDFVKSNLTPEQYKQALTSYK